MTSDTPAPCRTGLWIVLVSLLLGTLSVVPLWLVSQSGGGEDGATGPALVALFGTLAGGLGAAIGLVWWLIEAWLRRR